MKLYYLIIGVMMGWVTFSSAPVTAQDTLDSDSSTTLKQVLQKNKYPVELAGGELKGQGGQWLLEQSKEATVVTVGEIHGTQEIPALVKALIGDLQEADEFEYLALEVSPWTAGQMSDSLKMRNKSYNKLIERYPNAIPFYNFKAELALIDQAVEGSKMQQPLWGLDQIFAFSTSMAFDRLKELAHSAEARSAVQSLRSQQSSADDPRLQNLPEGIPTSISVYRPSDFNQLKGHFKGVKEAQKILSELAESAKIYRLNDGQNYKSNQLRARYLRENLRSSVQQAHKSSDELTTIVIKIGARHAYKGRTPNNALDVGNLSVSLARSRGGEAFNVAVLCGPESKNRTFPNRVVKCEHPYLNEDIQSLINNEAILFDLTSLHPLLHNGSVTLDRDMEELFWGFDAVIFIPNTQAAEPIASPID